MLGGELGRERLDAEPRGEVRVARRGADEQVAGAEPPRVDVHEAVAVVELEAARACAAARRRDRTAACRSSAGACSRCRSPDSAQIEVLARRGRRRSTTAPAQSASTGAGGSRPRPARSRISASTIVRPSRSGRQLAADRLDLGELRHRNVSARRSGERLAGQLGASRPASHASALAPTSASGPSWRRPRAPAKRASSGACSRVWSVCGAAGSQPWSAVRTSRSSLAQQLEPAADARVDLAQRAVEALDVVAVAVDLVGLDQVREHEPALERRAAAAVVSLERARVGRAGVLDVDPDAGEQLADLADRVDLDAGVLELLEVAARRRREREVAPAVGALEAPGAPSNGRAITRPTACSAGSPRADASSRSRTAPRLGTTSTCAAICSTESWLV